MAEFAGCEMINAEELRDYVEKNGVSRVGEYVSSKLDDWKNVVIHFAVCGASGAGKSSFINRIRGLTDFDDDAADIDVIECTKEPKCYHYPSNPNIKFWDLPGLSGAEYDGDLEKYSENVPLDKYHTYLIFAKDRFIAENLKLAERIRSIGKKFFFVRAKIDQDVENGNRICEEDKNANVTSEKDENARKISEKDKNAKRSRKRLFDKDALLERIREKLSQNLIGRGLLEDKKEIFLISNHFVKDYQFGELTEAILAILPQRQRESLILTLNNAKIVSKNTLKEKVEVLKKRIKGVASKSAVAAAVPIPGVSIAVDIWLIKRETDFYISQLGLPKEGSNEFSLLNFDTQTKVKALNEALDSAMKIGGLVAAYATESVLEEFTRYTPFIGIAIASPVSYGATYYFLSEWLGRMEVIALDVLTQTLQKVRSQKL